MVVEIEGPVVVEIEGPVVVVGFVGQVVPDLDSLEQDYLIVDQE